MKDGKSSKDKGYSLRDWFKGGGWKQTGGKYDGKPCAKQPGQTTKPYCRDPDDRAAMSKDERNKRAAKKRREDPNPDRTGKAKIVTQEETKKDACYKKVKASAKVWPSAYASGRLVQCRKKGAANWGNKSESYEFSNWRDDFQATEYEFVDIIKPEPIKGGQHINENVSSGRSRLAKSGRVAGKIVGAVTNTEKSKEFEKQKAKDISNDKSFTDKVDVSGLSPAEALTRKRQAERKAARERIKSKEKAEKERFKGGRFGRMREEAELDEKCWDGYTQQGMKKKGKKVVPNCVPVGEEKHTPTKSDLESSIGGGNLKKLTKKAVKRIDYDVDGDVDPNDRIEKKTGDYGEELPTPFGKFRTGNSKKVKVNKEEFSNWREELSEGAAWTKKSGKSESGGLNEKGRKSYERENPGSDLKAPSKKVGNPRRKSFCARMKGMKKKLTSSKTANDPDSRINKSLRAWNC